MIVMTKDDVTSLKNAKLASAVLRGTVKPTVAQVKTLAAIVLDNAANKKKR
jgi:hypothetical protein